MKYLALISITLSLQACSPSMYEEGTLIPSRKQVVEEQYYDKIHTSELATIDRPALIQHYHDYGEGEVGVIGFYDPQSGNKKLVKSKVDCLSNSLRKAGIGVYNQYLPVSEASALSVNYNYMSAQGPKDCKTMAGFANTDIGNNENYRIGCTVETLIAQQVSDPRDLLGRSYGDTTSDARSATNIINAYRSGAQNEPLQGFQASE